MNDKNKLDLLGKTCKDIVSGYEGICTGRIDFLYGCETYSVRGKAEKGTKPEVISLYRNQIEVLDDGIRDRVIIPEYEEPELFGKECRDKVTGLTGICVARIISLFSGPQYMLEFQPEDFSKDTRLLWMDEARLEVMTEHVEPEDVQSSRPGGLLDASDYPILPNGIVSIV